LRDWSKQDRTSDTQPTVQKGKWKRRKKGKKKQQHNSNSETMIISSNT